jgi:hypothetical protein
MAVDLRSRFHLTAEECWIEECHWLVEGVRLLKMSQSCKVVFDLVECLTLKMKDTVILQNIRNCLPSYTE